MNEPTCGKCGGIMTPQDSRIHPEFFLHDACLPDELKPKDERRPGKSKLVYDKEKRTIVAESQRNDEAWMHAACLTIAETGQKWGDSIHPSPAMEAVYKLYWQCHYFRSMTNVLADKLGRWTGQPVPTEIKKARSIVAENQSYDDLAASGGIVDAP